MQNVNVLDVSCTYYTHFPRNMCIVRIFFMLQVVYKYAKSGFSVNLGWIVTVRNFSVVLLMWGETIEIKKISNDQELIQSDPISCPQNQKGNN